MKRIIGLCLAMVLVPVLAFGQQLFLMDMTVADGKIQLGQAEKISANPDYNSQPSFLPDGSAILFISMPAGGDEAMFKAEINKYVLADKKIVPVTQNETGEFSPVVTPDGKSISAVGVEADKTQRLWKFDLEGKNPVLVLENVKPVGYYGWAPDGKTVAMFVLGATDNDPSTMQIADTTDPKAEAKKVEGMTNVGRSFLRIPGQEAMSFILKVKDTETEKEWWIKKIDMKTQAITDIVKTLDGSEDCAWLSDGTLLMGQGPKLFKFNAATDKEWQEVGDLSAAGVKQLNRLAVSPDGTKLVVVGVVQ